MFTYNICIFEHSVHPHIFSTHTNSKYLYTLYRSTLQDEYEAFPSHTNTIAVHPDVAPHGALTTPPSTTRTPCRIYSHHRFTAHTSIYYALPIYCTLSTLHISLKPHVVFYHIFVAPKACTRKTYQPRQPFQKPSLIVVAIILCVACVKHNVYIYALYCGLGG